MELWYVNVPLCTIKQQFSDIHNEATSEVQKKQQVVVLLPGSLKIQQKVRRICGKGYESLITSWHSSFQRNKQGTHLLCKHFLYFFYSTDKIRLRMTCVVDCNTPNLQSFHECTDQRVRSPSFCQGVPSTCSAATLGSPAICDIRLVVTSDDSQHGWFFVFYLGIIRIIMETQMQILLFWFFLKTSDDSSPACLQCWT